MIQAEHTDTPAEIATVGEYKKSDGMKTLELYTTFACPHCKTLKKTIEEVIPEYSEQYQFREISASSPLGYIKSLKNNIHSAPTLLIDGQVVARTAISKTELNQILKSNL